MPLTPASIEYMAYYCAKVAASGMFMAVGAAGAPVSGSTAGNPVIGSVAGCCIHCPVAAS